MNIQNNTEEHQSQEEKSKSLTHNDSINVNSTFVSLPILPKVGIFFRFISPCSKRVDKRRSKKSRIMIKKNFDIS